LPGSWPAAAFAASSLRTSLWVSLSDLSSPMRMCCFIYSLTPSTNVARPHSGSIRQRPGRPTAQWLLHTLGMTCHSVGSWLFCSLYPAANLWYP
jgi:hypothetical protein